VTKWLKKLVTRHTNGSSNQFWTVLGRGIVEHKIGKGFRLISAGFEMERKGLLSNHFEVVWSYCCGATKHYQTDVPFSFGLHLIYDPKHVTPLTRCRWSNCWILYLNQCTHIECLVLVYVLYIGHELWMAVMSVVLPEELA